MLFLRLWKILFLKPKMVSFVSETLCSIISSLILTNKQIKEKITFFVQKHGVTPLEKCDFWDYEKFCFYSLKRFLF